MPPARQTGAMLDISIREGDIRRVEKSLKRYQGAELAKRTDKALQGGLKLAVNPVRAGAMRHFKTGKTARSVGVKKLRKRPGEMAAYKVGIRSSSRAANRAAWYGHFPITGARAHSLKTKRSGKSKFSVFADGEVRPTAILRHPGFRGDPYVANAVMPLMPAIDDFIGYQLKRLV